MDKEQLELCYDVDDLVDYINRSVEEFFAVNECHEDVSPETLGLDRRAGRKFKVSPPCAIAGQFIAIHKNHSDGLNYYGGFEYVDLDQRKEIGDYVIYTPNWETENDDCECRILKCVNAHNDHINATLRNRA